MKQVTFFLLLALLGTNAMAQKKPEAKHAGTKPVSHAATGQSSLAKGKAVYMKTCVSCHQKDGGGVMNMNPPLINTSYVSGDKQKLISIIIHGISRQPIDGDSFTNVMPPFTKLSDEDIANVLTYVRKSFGNKYSSVTAAEVKEVREKK